MQCTIILNICTPHPETIFKNVKKLTPGSKLIYKNKRIKLNKFYFTKPKRINRDLTIGNVVKELDRKLKEVIEEHMNTDVAYGAFLSGIDSSLVASIMQSISKKPINTFSIGFEGNKKDETIYSKMVSEYLNTNHLEKIIRPNDVKKIFLKFYHYMMSHLLITVVYLHISYVNLQGNTSQ